MAGRIITITQQKGGSGKTTLTAHLATSLALNHRKKVAFVDTDPQGSLGRWYMTRVENGFDEKTKFGFRTASAWGARFEARALSEDHDLVLIDTPPKMGIDGRTAIEAADLVIVPITPSPVDLWATEPTLEMAVGEKKPIMVVKNRVTARAKINAETDDAVQSMGFTFAKSTIGNRVLFAASMGEGKTIFEKQATGIGAAEVKALSSEILRLLKKL